MFPRATIIQIIEFLGFRTNAILNRFLLRFGMDDIQLDQTIAHKENAIIQYLIDNPDNIGPLGANITIEIIEYAMTLPFYMANGFPEALINSLQRDGFVIQGDRLRRTLPEVVNTAENENQVYQLLDQFEFDTARGHLDQAISAHTRGEWAAANGQLRPFIESLFHLIATRLNYTGETGFYTIGQYLTGIDPPFIYTELNEWELGNNGGFLQGFWSRLHPAGPHAGLSDEEDCTFRLQMILLVASHYLNRLDERI